MNLKISISDLPTASEVTDQHFMVIEDSTSTKKISAKEFHEKYLTKQKKAPTLTAAQKNAIAALMKDYYDNRNRFEYEFEHNRNAFSRKLDTVIDGKTHLGCWNPSTQKYRLNCNTFVQMIMMGRKISDFPANGDYHNSVDKAFTFGYYPEFLNHQYAAGLLQSPSSQDPSVRYYGFRNPKGDANYVGSYSNNSYYLASSDEPGSQNLNNYMNANDLAFELWAKGCEIPLSEIDVGDILFCRDPAPADFYHEQIFWRQISHAFMVYRIVDGCPAFMDCTPTDDPSKNIIISRLNREPYGGTNEWKADRTKALWMYTNTVFAARLPIAWGIQSNVPDSITRLQNAAELAGQT